MAGDGIRQVIPYGTGRVQMGDQDEKEPAPPAEPAATGPAGPEGGESVCWLEHVCPECGRLADTAPPVRCTRCGTLLTG